MRRDPLSFSPPERLLTKKASKPSAGRTSESEYSAHRRPYHRLVTLIRAFRDIRGSHPRSMLFTFCLAWLASLPGRLLNSFDADLRDEEQQAARQYVGNSKSASS